MWFFDDPDLDIQSEAFVDGADTLLTDVVKSLGIKREHDGVYRVPLEFSPDLLPFSTMLEKTGWSSSYGDDFTVYRVVDVPGRIATGVTQIGLCPTLFKYHESAPRYLFIKILD